MKRKESRSTEAPRVLEIRGQTGKHRRALERLGARHVIDGVYRAPLEARPALARLRGLEVKEVEGRIPAPGRADAAARAWWELVTNPPAPVRVALGYGRSGLERARRLIRGD